MIKKILLAIICLSAITPFLTWAENDSVNVGLQVTCPGGRCVKGCMDTTATNYNSLATMDTTPTSCIYNPIRIEVRGCMDPLANNYNSRATIDDRSCDYNVPAASGVNASYSNGRVHVSWSNPSYMRFDHVRVIKSSSVPSGPNSGEVVYEGGGQSVNDDDVTVGSRYYYAVYVYSTANRNSSGAIASILIPGTVPVSGCTNPSATNYNAGATIDNGSCRYANPPVIVVVGGSGSIGGGTITFPRQPSPFDVFQNIGTTTLNILGLRKALPTDFFVFQPGEGSKIIYEGQALRIRRDKPITIYVQYDKMPEVLKTIGVTIFDPVEPADTTSVILSYNKEKNRYEATINAPKYGGNYPVSIYLINYSDQTMEKINTAFIVPGTTRDFLASGVLISKAADTALVSTGLAAGIASLLSSFTRVGSIYDIYLLILRGLGALLGLLGIRRRSKPWGTIYDSVTKRPLDPAYVTVLWNGREMGSAITDIEGRYGFFLTAGQHTLNASKTHYKFPSERLAGKQSDELYGDLYFGEQFTTTGQEIINRNIPMDPVDFDWNEFAKTKNNFFKIHTRREVFKSYFFNIIYVVGFVLSAVRFVLAPSYFDLAILIVYLGLYAFQYFWRLRHKVVMIKRQNGEPLSFAIIRFFMSGVNLEARSVVADMMGRFYILIRPGIYYYTVEEKLPDGTYKKIYKSPDINMPKGVLKTDIIIGEDDTDTGTAENPVPPTSPNPTSSSHSTPTSTPPLVPAPILTAQIDNSALNG